MDLIKALNTRYSTKEFDPTKKISDENLEKIETLLQLSPSSTNVQPWHFILATSEEGKKRISKATQGFFSFNDQKVLKASAVVIFASKSEITYDYLDHVLDTEDSDGRFAEPKMKNDSRMVRKIFADIHKYDYKDTQHWAEKQVYLNLGNFLLGLAHLGIDAVPMEGVDMKILDEEFKLREKDFTSVVVVALGYHASTDYNASLPKSRFAKEEIIERV